MKALILNANIKDRFDRGATTEFPLSLALISMVRAEITKIHNWKNFCRNMGIKYSVFMNLKDARLQYLNHHIIDVCEALDIDLNEYYPEEEEADQASPEGSED